MARRLCLNPRGMGEWRDVDRGVGTGRRWGLLFAAVAVLAACSGAADGSSGGSSVRPAAGGTGSGPVAAGPGEGLFVAAGDSPLRPSEPQVARARLVRVELGQLLRPEGPADRGSVTFNLFPDATVTGVIEHVETSGDSVSWSGRLDGVELGTFSMVHTAGVFMAHVASPRGVYEVTVVDGDRYRVVQIDQTKFPGGRD